MKKQEAIDMAGGVGKLAEVLEVTRYAVMKWDDELPKARYFQLRGLVAEKQWKPVNGAKFPGFR